MSRPSFAEVKVLDATASRRRVDSYQLSVVSYQLAVGGCQLPVGG